ncbi:bifunctional lysylphosphatidylglycerol flippase/synthetase MprF [Kitasatospora griseola]|uniref:Phosphatidylglycerol lysyltransferase C-terminal domain-containing protein n=1 Tax=Kitasatospora griseola TaxID=2064 RepID=A0A0D0PW34_KITGR|nr:DUF2156 domain-containing protein [Kitasatospora griseola]KIQ62763.1 hypothetical protein TR51_27865 [Kitasatospora griseola]GGQ97675.1 hypothetical protein GCM10010195_61890 [Kitasatospora griseola]
MADNYAESDKALEAIQKYTVADNPSAFLAVNSGNSYFSSPSSPGVIVYRPTGRYLVQFGGPFAPAESRAALLKDFVAFAAEQDRTIVAVQVQDADAEPYLEQGFTINQMGASYAIDLSTFSLRGTAFMQLRNKIARSLRSGLEVREVPLDDWEDQMRALDASWLGTKGEGVKQLEFLVGQYGGHYQSMRRLFVGILDGKLAGYITYSPVYGAQPGWLHDLTRRLPSGPPGVMEAINKTAIDVFTAEGVKFLHFGFTPFTSLDKRPQLPGHSEAFHWFMSHLWENGAAVYPAQTQLAYKQKWAPGIVLPENIAFQHGASIPSLVHIFRACNAV